MAQNKTRRNSFVPVGHLVEVGVAAFESALERSRPDVNVHLKQIQLKNYKIKLQKKDIGCNTVVKKAPHNQEVSGYTPASCFLKYLCISSVMSP